MIYDCQEHVTDVQHEGALEVNDHGEFVCVNRKFFFVICLVAISLGSVLVSYTLYAVSVVLQAQSSTLEQQQHTINHLQEQVESLYNYVDMIYTEHRVNL